MSQPAKSKIVEEVLSANARYASNFGDKSQLGLPPARRFAVLTCMDARIDPAQLLGLREGDAHVIRNAGGTGQAEFIDWLTISDQAKSVSTDVERIRQHPLVPRDIPIYGYIYQVESGRLIEVPQATQIGRARVSEGG